MKRQILLGPAGLLSCLLFTSALNFGTLTARSLHEKKEQTDYGREEEV